MDFENKLPHVISTLSKILHAEGKESSASIVAESTASLRFDHHDNWNGGTDYYTLVLGLSPNEYVHFKKNKASLEEAINDALHSILTNFPNTSCGVDIVPAIQTVNSASGSESLIPREIRSNIFDGLQLEDVKWFGTYEEPEFLNRIFDLETMPSTDSRYPNAAGDIWQHCVNNDDWPLNWVFTDYRFNLLGCPNEVFLKFLCEIVHPVVRPDHNESRKLVKHFNEQLNKAGWHISVGEQIAGRPRFFAAPLGQANNRYTTKALKVAETLDASFIEKLIDRAETAIENDPGLAIGTAKEMIETVCKTILRKEGIEFSKSTDLLKLTRLVHKELELIPDDVSEKKRGADTIKVTLSNLATLTQKIAELRSLYGSGHGPDGQFRGLQPRHARLAVGTAVTYIDFITSTYKDRQRSGQK